MCYNKQEGAIFEVNRMCMLWQCPTGTCRWTFYHTSIPNPDIRQHIEDNSLARLLNYWEGPIVQPVCSPGTAEYGSVRTKYVVFYNSLAADIAYQLIPAPNQDALMGVDNDGDGGLGQAQLGGQLMGVAKDADGGFYVVDANLSPHSITAAVLQHAVQTTPYLAQTVNTFGTCLWWRDRYGQRCMTYFWSGPAHDQVSDALQVVSNACIYQKVSGPLVNQGLAALTNGPYGGPDDAAHLYFRDTANLQCRVNVPCPKPFLFLADGVTVDPAQVATITTPFIANGRSGRDKDILAFEGGRRIGGRGKHPPSGVRSN